MLMYMLYFIGLVFLHLYDDGQSMSLAHKCPKVI